jgi:hypothetical protein
MSDIKCEYALKCAAYRDNSYTCTKAFDKRYCGIYRQFISGAIKIYKQDFRSLLEPNH